MINHLLPINLTAHWTTQIQTDQCSEKMRSWLYDNNSLTQKLENLCGKFHVKVRQQRKISSVTPSLSSHFNNEKNLLLREVFLCCDNVPVVFAQTEIPLSTITQSQAQLTELGSQSLGKILFQDPTIKRGTIEVAQFAQKSQQVLSQSLGLNYQHPLWARRSFFYINDKPLLVSELFLPELGIY